MSKMVTGCIKMFLIIHTHGTKLSDYQRIAAFRDLQIQIRFCIFVPLIIITIKNYGKENIRINNNNREAVQTTSQIDGPCGWVIELRKERHKYLILKYIHYETIKVQV